MDPQQVQSDPNRVYLCTPPQGTRAPLTLWASGIDSGVVDYSDRPRQEDIGLVSRLKGYDQRNGG